MANSTSYKKGVSGNLNGRPKGSKNKSSKLRDEIIASYSMEDVKSVLDNLWKKATQEDCDVAAAKSFLDYLIPKADKVLEVEDDSYKDVDKLEIIFTEKMISKKDGNS